MSSVIWSLFTYFSKPPKTHQLPNLQASSIYFPFDHSCLQNNVHIAHSTSNVGYISLHWDKLLWLNVGKLPWDVQISHLTSRTPTSWNPCSSGVAARRYQAWTNMPSALRMPFAKKNALFTIRGGALFGCLVLLAVVTVREKNDSENLEFLSCGVFR